LPLGSSRFLSALTASAILSAQVSGSLNSHWEGSVCVSIWSAAVWSMSVSMPPVMTSSVVTPRSRTSNDAERDKLAPTEALTRVADRERLGASPKGRDNERVSNARHTSDRSVAPSSCLPNIRPRTGKPSARFRLDASCM
jgi:hypothetical protein